MTESQRVLQQIKGKLVVSCQALPHEPLHSSYIMSRMAVAAMQGGAAGIRAQSVSDINAIAEVCHLPIIGIVKRNYDDSEIYITSRDHSDGCDMQKAAGRYSHERAY